jgi:hypothetical protein
VVLVPSPIVTAPFGRNPRVSSGVLVESGTVPVPVASGLDELVALEEVEELDEAELVEEEDPLDPDELDPVVLLEPPFIVCSADCTALLS